MLYVIITNVLAVILVLGVMILVHEMGHYLVARFCGVRVEVFSVGFGPEIYGWNDRRGTRWRFSLIPIGGYVKMFGEQPGGPGRDGEGPALSATERAESFAAKTLGVYVPRDVDRALRGARSMREASISLLLLVWERLSTFASEIGYPEHKLGVNVEYLDSRNPRNVDAAFELAEEFGRQLKRL